MDYEKIITDVLDNILKENISISKKQEKVNNILRTIEDISSFCDSDTLNKLNDDTMYFINIINILKQIEETSIELDKKISIFEQLINSDFDNNRLSELNRIKRFRDNYNDFYISLIESSIKKTINNDSEEYEINLINNAKEGLKYKFVLFCEIINPVLREISNIEAYVEHIDLLRSSWENDTNTINFKISALRSLKDSLTKLLENTEYDFSKGYINYLIDIIEQELVKLSLLGISKRDKRY